jgi:predicted amidohydrolase
VDTGTARGPLAVSVAQLKPVIGDVAANLEAIETIVRHAAHDGARLIVLPELCTTGYVFRDRAEAEQLAEPSMPLPNSRRPCRSTSSSASPSYRARSCSTPRSCSARAG